MPNQQPQNFNCAAVAEHLHEFLDGELPGELVVAVQRHLRTCAECTNVLYQFRSLEAAHLQLDTKLESPPEEFWQAFPARVMKRVKAAERRRLLALPRFRPASLAARAASKQPPGRIFFLPPRLQAFINGPGKYAIALATLAAFCFVLIREFTEQPRPVTTAYKAAGRDVASVPSEVEETKPATITPPSARQQQESTPATTQPKKSLPDVPSQIDLLGKQAAGSGESAMLAMTPESANTQIISRIPTTLDSKSAEERAEQIPGGQGVALQQEATYDLRSQSVHRLESKQEQRGGGEPSNPSVSALATQTDKKGAIMTATMKPPAEPSPFSQTLWQAQHTADLKKREKIWRQFL
ncbi:MAG: zf-HC2 domain-containing protein, partial [candidate division KSB1 bacterium]|nr:zf-HC2 domain-containing protein [candidate division KSB1 bacterium]